MRTQLNSDINELLKQFLEKEIYDSLYRYYEGKIEDNNDPDKLGRCKIRVYGLFSDSIPTADLPWAIPDFNFVGSKLGSFVIPPLNAIVYVRFDRGDIYQPHYTTKVIDKQNLPEERLTDYPNNMIIFKTDEGDCWEINRQTKKLTFTHNSGTKIEMDVDGNVDILVKNNLTTTVENNSEENVTGYIQKKATRGNITLQQESGGASIEIDNLGTINITQGATGSVNIGGVKAQLYCPDLQVCPITGSPLSVLSKIPGSMVKVP